MLLLYVGTSFVIWLGFRFVSGFIEKVRLKSFDRQIGAIFGMAKGVVLCIIITLFAVTLLGEAQRQTIINSQSGHYIALLLDRAHGVMPSEIHDVLHPYVHEPLTNDPTQAGNDRPLDQLIPVDELLQALEKEFAAPNDGARRGDSMIR